MVSGIELHCACCGKVLGALAPEEVNDAWMRRVEWLTRQMMLVCFWCGLLTMPVAVVISDNAD